MSDEKLYKKLLSIPDVCRLYNIKESWVRRQIFLKRIPYIKMGRLIRFNVWDLEKWIEKAID